MRTHQLPTLHANNNAAQHNKSFMFKMKKEKKKSQVDQSILLYEKYIN